MYELGLMTTNPSSHRLTSGFPFFRRDILNYFGSDFDTNNHNTVNNVRYCIGVIHFNNNNKYLTLLSYITFVNE